MSRREITMERLTERDEYGNADIIGVDGAELQLNLEFKELNLVTDALNRLTECELCLTEYEDTGLTPKEIKELKADRDYWKAEALKHCAKLGEIKLLVGRKEK